MAEVTAATVAGDGGSRHAERVVLRLVDGFVERRPKTRPAGAAIEDAELVKRLAAERVPLTMCPLSNVKLRVFKSLKDHNIKTLLHKGLCVSVNSDDPAYFGGYVLDNYAGLQEALGLTRGELARLAKNSFDSSFLPASEKRRWNSEIDALAAR